MLNQQLPESLAHPPVEVLVLGLQTIRHRRQPSGPDGVVKVQEQGQVGKQALGGPHVERDDVVAPKPAAVALVGERRVEIAVAQHHLTVFQGRPDDLLDQMCARAAA